MPFVITFLTNETISFQDMPLGEPGRELYYSVYLIPHCGGHGGGLLTFPSRELAAWTRADWQPPADSRVDPQQRLCQGHTTLGCSQPTTKRSGGTRAGPVCLTQGSSASPHQPGPFLHRRQPSILLLCRLSYPRLHYGRLWNLGMGAFLHKTY